MTPPHRSVAPLLALVALVLAACAVEEGGKPELGEDESTGALQALAPAAALTRETPITGLSGAHRAELRFELVVPEGATDLRIAIAAEPGSTGDADLYVRFGEPPTTSLWDFRPYDTGNDETVVPPQTRVGTYHLMVRGYRAFTAVTLSASFRLPDDDDDDDDGAERCRDASQWPADWTAFEDEVLVLVNQKRAAGATCGGVSKPPVQALVMHAQLREAARCHSDDMATHGFMSHTGSDGSTPWQRINRAGYTYTRAAENVAAGYGTPAEVVAGWMGSTGHCNSIMNGDLRETGIGFAFLAGSGLQRYWTETFGTR